MSTGNDDNRTGVWKKAPALFPPIFQRIDRTDPTMFAPEVFACFLTVSVSSKLFAHFLVILERPSCTVITFR
jgi:hypothetical protein